MKIRSSIKAGAQGGCPEAQAYQQKAYAMMQKVYNCTPRSQGYVPPIVQGYVPPVIVPSYTIPSTGTQTGVVGSYPDRSGWCG